MTTILGISAYYHDSAAALLRDGEIIAAAQEERFTRIKHDEGYPRNAVDYCLAEAGLRLGEVDHIVFFEKPFLKFERLLETYVAFAPKGFASFKKAMPIWLREKLFQKDMLLGEFKKHDPDYKDEGRLKFSEHHLSHAASAFYPSPFEEAIVLTMDGVGEWATATAAIGRGRELTIQKEIRFPHSLGLLYSAVTYYTGFKVNSGEYKVMGLAPYGEPKYKDVFLEHIIDVRADGSFWLDQSFFNYCTGLTMVNEKFETLFGQPVRQSESEELTQFHMDMAASVQAVTEEIMLKLASGLRDEYGIKNLCLAGGVALNCVANGKLLREKIFDDIWIQPAAGDAGGALGAAQALWHGELGHDRVVSAGQDAMRGSYLGPSFEQGDIEQRLRDSGAIFNTLSEDEMIAFAAQALADEKAVGWFNGRMEFGPRALGGRSILGDPRSPNMQKTLNLKVKYRESFRPFAPSVLAEHASDYFELSDVISPYMLLVANVAKDKRRDMTPEEKALFGIDKLNVVRSDVPAITHVDYSARVQTVHAQTNPLYHALISQFYALTGCPLVVNTSFNVRGEPIVGTPEDAFKCFMGMELDVLVVGNCVLEKAAQSGNLAEDYTQKYELD
jgi:carbamoyltransferase